MSQSERRAVIQEGLDLAHAFRLNMAIRHGLPMPLRNTIGSEVQIQAEPTPVIAPETPAITPMPLWKKLAAGAAIGTTLGGGAGYLLYGRNPAPVPVVEQPGSILEAIAEKGLNKP